MMGPLHLRGPLDEHLLYAHSAPKGDVMGITKRQMEEDEARHQMGIELCIEAGALEECEYHPGSIYSGDEEVEEAYKLANARASKGQIEISERFTRRDLTDYVKKAYEDNCWATECMSCEKVLRD